MDSESQRIEEKRNSPEAIIVNTKNRERDR